MIPVRDDNPHFITPISTIALIGLNVAAWVMLQGLGSEPSLSTSVCTLGLIPGELLQTIPVGTTVALGPDAACMTTPNPTWYTLVTSMFLHGGWMHIVGNMWFMWIFGNNVEDSMGHTRFVVFYLMCGLIAAALQVSSNPDSSVPMVGASGAIGGVMGAYIVLYPRVRVHMLLWLGFYVTTVSIPAVAMLGYWLAVQLLGGLSTFGAEGGGTAFWAHVGGFVAGSILIFPFRNPILVDRHPYHGWRPLKNPKRHRR